MNAGNCAACLKVLACQVKFCPFCGVGQSQAAPAASVPSVSLDAAQVPLTPPPAASNQPSPVPAPASLANDSAKQEAAAKKAAAQKAAEKSALKKMAAEVKAAEVKAAEVKAAEVKAAAAAALAEEAAKELRRTNSADTDATVPGNNSGGAKKRMGPLTKLVLFGVVILVVFWIRGTMVNHDEQRTAQEGLERQTTAAMTLAGACKLDEARAAMQALDDARGTPQQHATVQKAISDATPDCASSCAMPRHGQMPK